MVLASGVLGPGVVNSACVIGLIAVNVVHRSRRLQDGRIGFLRRSGNQIRWLGMGRGEFIWMVAHLSGEDRAARLAEEMLRTLRPVRRANRH